MLFLGRFLLVDALFLADVLLDFDDGPSLEENEVLFFPAFFVKILANGVLTTTTSSSLSGIFLLLTREQDGASRLEFDDEITMAVDEVVPFTSNDRFLDFISG